MENWIPAVTALLGIMLGAFLQRWNDDRKRKLDRRIEIYDRNLREAMDFVNLAYRTQYLAAQVIHAIIEKRTNVESFRQSMDQLRVREKDAEVDVNRTLGKQVSFSILGDKELLALYENMIKVYFPQILTVFEVADKIEMGTFDEKDFDFEKLSKLPGALGKELGKIKARLDKLRQEIH